MEPDARKRYHRTNRRIYTVLNREYENLEEYMVQHSSDNLYDNDNKTMVFLIKRALMTIHEAFEARPAAVERGSPYLRVDDLDIRQRLFDISRKIHTVHQKTNLKAFYCTPVIQKA